MASDRELDALAAQWDREAKRLKALEMEDTLAWGLNVVEEERLHECARQLRELLPPKLSRKERAQKDEFRGLVMAGMPEGSARDIILGRGVSK